MNTELCAFFMSMLEKVGASYHTVKNREEGLKMVRNDSTTAIIESSLAVAENGAVWISDLNSKERVLPFDCEHLVVLVAEKSIVFTMHEAYEKIGDEDYGFGVFISGPSKTADIEQSLVKGAHGQGAMTVFVMGE